MRVADLTPGDEFRSPQGDVHTFIAHLRHPSYPHLRQVIWILADGTAMFDALSPAQEITEWIPTDDPGRVAALRRALTRVNRSEDPDEGRTA